MHRSRPPRAVRQTHRQAPRGPHAPRRSGEGPRCPRRGRVPQEIRPDLRRRQGPRPSATGEVFILFVDDDAAQGAVGHVRGVGR